MVAVDIRHDDRHRLQKQERSIALVRLRDEVSPRAEPGVAAFALQQPTDHIGGIQPGVLENRRDQAGRGRLAVGAGNRDTVPITHEFAKHRRPRHHGHAPLTRQGDLGIVLADGGGDHDDVGAARPVAVMADVDRNTLFRKTFRIGRAHVIRTRNGITLVHEDFRDTAHAGTADADKVNALDAPHPRVHFTALHARRPPGAS